MGWQGQGFVTMQLGKADNWGKADMRYSMPNGESKLSQ